MSIGYAEFVYAFAKGVRLAVDAVYAHFIDSFGIVEGFHECLVGEESVRQVVRVYAALASVFHAVGGAYEIDGGVVFKVAYVEHQR